MAVDVTPDLGYAIGPSIPPDEHPWPLMWEQDPRIDDGHAHEWECVLLQADGRHRVRVEEVVRCGTCHAPRCGDSADADPCMERRHHRGLHIHLSGRFRTLGDLPPSLEDEADADRYRWGHPPGGSR